MPKKKDWSLRVPMHVSVPTTLITQLESRAREEGAPSFSGFVESILRKGLFLYAEEREFAEREKTAADLERIKKLALGSAIRDEKAGLFVKP